MKFFSIIVVSMALITLGCGGKSSSSSSSSSAESGLYLATNAAKSTPQIYGSLSSSNIAAPKVVYDVGSDSTSAIESIEEFFKLECHDDQNTLNFCPSGVVVDLTTKFTTTTLIGLIQHADMYLGNIYTTENVVDPETGESVETPTYKTCERGDDAVALTNHTAVYTPSSSSLYVLDFGTLFDCTAQFTASVVTSYVVYSKAEDNITFAGLTSRREDYGSVGGVSYRPSDIFQSYVRRAQTGDPVMLGSNLVSYSNYPDGGGSNSGQRAILITNISANRFIVKYGMGDQSLTAYDDPYSYLVAAGTGGYNPSSAAWVDGYYMVKTKDLGGDTMITCVQNANPPVIMEGPTAFDEWSGESEYCSDVAGYFGTTGWTFSEVLSYLEASSADATNLAGFEGFFDDDDILTSADIPADGTTYFPTSISN